MRLLVVEDEQDLQSAIVQALRENGYAVDAAGDGKEGLYKATSAEYDAIVLDLMLPNMNGYDVLNKLRPTCKTPVLMLTARDSLPDRVKGLDAGADDYLTKPFEIPELLARLRALIRRAAGKASSQIVVGEVAIDTATRTVTKSEKLIPLTPREYSLVEFLCVHKGELVTRSMIYEHLFDEEDDTLSNLVDVHVSNVRRKLGKEFITTRRGEGYVIHV
jgi:two-component system OmpR family response regulator